MSFPPATRWGVAGSGAVCNDFCNALTATGASRRHEVVAVAARDLHKAEEFADKFNISKAYGGYAGLAMDDNVEIVYIGTVHSTHRELVELYLNAGKHVLCEKPLALNAREVKEMVELAEEKGLFFMEAMWMKFQPAYKKLREEIASNSIGDVKQLAILFGLNIPDEARYHRLELGGGTVLEHGVYCVYLSQLVFADDPTRDKPYQITAVAALNEEGTDNGMTVTMLYSNGRTSTFVTQSRAELTNEAYIFGTSGMIKMCAPFEKSRKLVTPTRTYEYPLPAGTKHDFVYSEFMGGLLHEADHVRECLLDGLRESPVVRHAETVAVAEMLDDIKRQIGVQFPPDRLD